MKEAYKNMPVDMVFGIAGSPSSVWISWNIKQKFGERFKDVVNIEPEIKIIQEYYKNNPEELEKRIAKSPRTVAKYVDINKKRLCKEAELIFLGKAKNKYQYIYYRYCAKFNIITDDYMQLVTEVAVGSAANAQKEYVNALMNKRKNCKKFIQSFLENINLNKSDSIEKLLECL